MKVLIDGLIYDANLEKTRGIRRYFNGFLPLLTKLDSKIKIELLLHHKKIPILWPQNIFHPLIQPINDLLVNKQWQKIKGDIFHSTYYTRHPFLDMLQVVTVYDMIHERLSQYYQGRGNNLFRLRKKTTIEAADAIICISQNTKQDVLKYCRVDKNKIYVIYPGVDATFRKIQDKKIKNKFLKKYKINKPFLLYVGQRSRYKNFLSLIKAYALWNKKVDFDIVTVGGNKFDSEELLILNKLNISSRIYNFNNVDNEDLVLFYNSAHALVMPSFYEGFGFPILEAMACGTLVLSSNRSSLPEIGKNCVIYFDPYKINDILRALNDSLLEKRRLKLIKQGLKRAKEFSWEKTAKQTLAVYKSFYNGVS